jgi:hypothetical protein
MKALIDADRIIYQFSSLAQTNGIRATNLITKEVAVHGSKTDFNLWLKEKEEDKANYDVETIVLELKPISFVLHSLKVYMENTFGNIPWASEVVFGICGHGNFRTDLATLAPYKGQRPKKPEMFLEVKEYFIKKYKPVIVYGQETDDWISIQGWESYRIARAAKDRDASTVVICSEDKDLMSVPGWHWNFVKHKPIELVWVNDNEAWRYYCTQLLTGDSSDNILGLAKSTQELREHFKLKKSSGIGPVAAHSILEKAKTKREMLEAVVTAYKLVYGDEYPSILKENALLLRMRAYEGEMFNILDVAEKWGVS